MTMLTFIGSVGMVFLLIAFVANQFKKLDADTVLYNLLNVLGGGVLTYYAIELDSVPFIVLEIIWTGFALYKLVRVSMVKQ